MRDDYCTRVHTLFNRRKRACPERVVTMADSVLFVSRDRIRAAPLWLWGSVQALLDGPNAAANAQLMEFAWHQLFGQQAVLHSHQMHRH